MEKNEEENKGQRNVIGEVSENNENISSRIIFNINDKWFGSD